MTFSREARRQVRFASASCRSTTDPDGRVFHCSFRPSYRDRAAVLQSIRRSSCGTRRGRTRPARWTIKYTKAKPKEDGVPQVDLAIPAFGYKNLSLSEIPSVLPATN